MAKTCMGQSQWPPTDVNATSNGKPSSESQDYGLGIRRQSRADVGQVETREASYGRQDARKSEKHNQVGIWR
jgi:hypothetical protein